MKALVSGPRSRVPAPVYHAYLTMLAVAVTIHKPVDDVFGGVSFGEQSQPARTITQVRPRLGGNRARACLRPRDDRPDGQELTGDRHAELAGVQVRGGDGECRRRDS